MEAKDLIEKKFQERLDEDDSIQHYGVMGMKWGVRRYQPYSVRGRKSGKTGREIGEAIRSKIKEKRANAKAVKQRKRDLENRRTMTDEELSKKIERIKMERQLKNLIQEDLHPGKAATKRVLADVGQDVAKDVLKGTSKTIIRGVLGEDVTAKNIGEYLKPKKK